MIRNVRLGKIVLYVHKIDASQSTCGVQDNDPDISPAIVTKVLGKDRVNLKVFTSNGEFFAHDIPHGNDRERGTWHFQFLD